ncbi:hypothetical protein AVEN_101705-1 [Araneus ventricosus]|uniref:Uncharacterized protein n=1 Tax=Araneus ventricosus TaxID=182803 RepID=A0A4Y2TJM5_ARAVE|nr:hypothetical protein AVEN_101705-1 [Araneus ventricosus]
MEPATRSTAPFGEGGEGAREPGREGERSEWNPVPSMSDFSVKVTLPKSQLPITPEYYYYNQLPSEPALDSFSPSKEYTEGNRFFSQSKAGLIVLVAKDPFSPRVCGKEKLTLDIAITSKGPFRLLSGIG